MFVKIERCAIPSYWYHSEIGNIFEVSDQIRHDSYKVISGENSGVGYIQKLDCRILENIDDAKKRKFETKPSEAQLRKETPIYSGVLNYFPDALRAVAQASFAGQQQHNPDLPLAWDRSKSGDELDALTRHLLEAGTVDTDGVRHSTKVAWRALANLQKELEQAELEQTKTNR